MWAQWWPRWGPVHAWRDYTKLMYHFAIMLMPLCCAIFDTADGLVPQGSWYHRCGWYPRSSAVPSPSSHHHQHPSGVTLYCLEMDKCNSKLINYWFEKKTNFLAIIFFFNLTVCSTKPKSGCSITWSHSHVIFVVLIPQHKTVMCSLLMHWSYHSLAINIKQKLYQSLP